MSDINPIGTEFFDKVSQRQMILVNEPGHTYDGWVCFKHPDGQWVTLRKPSEHERTAILGGKRTTLNVPMPVSAPPSVSPQREPMKGPTPDEIWQAAIEGFLFGLEFHDEGYESNRATAEGFANQYVAKNPQQLLSAPAPTVEPPPRITDTMRLDEIERALATSRHGSHVWLTTVRVPGKQVRFRCGGSEGNTLRDAIDADLGGSHA